MYQTTVSSRGQITLPKVLREKLELQEGDRVQFSLLPNGEVRLLPRGRDLMDSAGLLAGKSTVKLTVDEINEGIANAAAGR